jgi:hypothetical protein
MSPAKKLEKMSDEDIKTVWNALDTFDANEKYDGNMTMTDWASLVYSEVSRRGLIVFGV